jgi:outer membrane protein assembly factor BamB
LWRFITSTLSPLTTTTAARGIVALRGGARVVAGSTMYTAAEDTYALDATTGSLRWNARFLRLLAATATTVIGERSRR